jgi:hypothetical protein
MKGKIPSPCQQLNPPPRNLDRMRTSPKKPSGYPVIRAGFEEENAGVYLLSVTKTVTSKLTFIVMCFVFQPEREEVAGG